MTRPPPDPSCACGHPRASHHRTDTGRIAQCTVWHSTGIAVATHCPCKAYTPQEDTP